MGEARRNRQVVAAAVVVVAGAGTGDAAAAAPAAAAVTSRRRRGRSHDGAGLGRTRLTAATGRRRRLWWWSRASKSTRLRRSSGCGSATSRFHRYVCCRPPPSILPTTTTTTPPPTSCVGLCLCSGCPCLALPLGRRPQEDQLRCTLETRQFTYRAGESNPLFGPLDEDGRRAVLQRDLVGELEVRPRLTSSGVPVREVDLIAANNHEANEVGAVRSTRARVRASLEP